jgi:hypothetical protein
MVTCAYSPYGDDHSCSNFDSLRNIDKVDATMSKITEQREIANEIADAISVPLGEADEVRRFPEPMEVLFS